MRDLGCMLLVRITWKQSPSLYLCSWKNCLPQNWSLMPKWLRTAPSADKTSAFCHASLCSIVVHFTKSNWSQDANKGLEGPEEKDLKLLSVLLIWCCLWQLTKIWGYPMAWSSSPYLVTLGSSWPCLSISKFNELSGLDKMLNKWMVWLGLFF